MVDCNNFINHTFYVGIYFIDRYAYYIIISMTCASNETCLCTAVKYIIFVCIFRKKTYFTRFNG